MTSVHSHRSMSCVCCVAPWQERGGAGLRDAHGPLAVPGGRQAGDLPQHLPAQRQLRRGGAAPEGRRRARLHPEPALQAAPVSRRGLCASHDPDTWLQSMFH